MFNVLPALADQGGFLEAYMVNEKLSVEEIAAMYCRLKSRVKNANKIELDMEQLLFHALAGLNEQDLESVKKIYFDSGTAGSPYYRLENMLEGKEQEKFPAHEHRELDPDCPWHPSTKVKRF